MQNSRARAHTHTYKKKLLPSRHVVGAQRLSLVKTQCTEFYKSLGLYLDLLRCDFDFLRNLDFLDVISRHLNIRKDSNPGNCIIHRNESFGHFNLGTTTVSEH